jgi:S1-C subfamily serine protease
MNPLRSWSDAVSAVVERARPAVLHLRTITAGRPGGSGSGFLCGADGLALTNHHVVAEADAVEATLHDGRSMLVDVVGQDPHADLALLRLPEVLPPIELGDSTKLRIGDFVLAVGCPHGLGHSVSAGIVSGLGRSLRGRTGRSIEEVIQTDAPLNPGNSGGPLLDAEGRAVGIATAIAFPAQGLCFAVPASTASFVVPELLAWGRVIRGYLGIGLEGIDLTRDQQARMRLRAPRALAVAGVQKDGPAAAAGLKAGDVLLQLDGRQLGTTADLYRVLDRNSIGRAMEVRVLRSGNEVTLRVTPRELPLAA